MCEISIINKTCPRKDYNFFHVWPLDDLFIEWNSTILLLPFLVHNLFPPTKIFLHRHILSAYFICTSDAACCCCIVLIIVDVDAVFAFSLSRLSYLFYLYMNTKRKKENKPHLLVCISFVQVFPKLWLLPCSFLHKDFPSCIFV